MSNDKTTHETLSLIEAFGRNPPSEQELLDGYDNTEEVQQALDHQEHGVSSDTQEPAGE